MTILEKYGLYFKKFINQDKSKSYFCYSHEVNADSELQIITYLNSDECQALIYEIENALNGRYFDDMFSADLSGSDSIRLEPPNIIINDDYLISLIDMKGLLEEWIIFIKT